MLHAVHSIKGMAGNMGAMRLAQAALRAEHRLREHAEAEGELQLLARAIELTMAEIGLAS